MGAVEADVRRRVRFGSRLASTRLQILFCRASPPPSCLQHSCTRTRTRTFSYTLIESELLFGTVDFWSRHPRRDAAFECTARVLERLSLSGTKWKSYNQPERSMAPSPTGYDGDPLDLLINWEAVETARERARKERICFL